MTFGACREGGGERQPEGKKLDEIELLSFFMNIFHITRRMLRFIRAVLAPV